MKHFIQQLFKDKDGNFSLRELATALFIFALIVSWIGNQFLKLDVPEFMFYTFASLVGAACFGYSLERKTNS
jgi:choline-glycine betaine transporter